MTPVDTLYEYAGYSLAGTLYELFTSVGLPLIIGLAGVAYAVHQMADRGSVQRLVVHVLYLIFAAWLLSPTNLQDVPTPRFVAYLGQAADLLQKRTVHRVNERFLNAPFEWERIAAMVSFGRILDPALGRDAARFLESCAKPALARAEPQGTNVFRPGTLPYETRCEQARAELWSRLRQHLQGDPFHQAAIQAAQRHDPAATADFFERYLDQVCVHALDDPGSPTSEGELVRASLGQYGYADPAQSTAPGGGWLRAMEWLSFMPTAISRITGVDTVDAGISAIAVLQQSWDNRFTGKQKYYLATVYGPHVYGLTLMFLIGLFPVAGLFALLPEKWGVLVNFAKVFLSVKLWPVCWAVLTSFNARRGAMEAFDPAGRGGADVFLAVASMYLLTPALTFLVVHLATRAAATAFAPAVPSSAGPGLGPVGVAVNVARAAK